MFSNLFGGKNKRNAELFEATSNGNVEGVQQALKKGADINALNLEFRETALHVAIDKSHIAVVELLLASGANPNIISNQNYTPAILAAAKGDSSLPILELLIAGKADLSLAPTDGPYAGLAPIHIATACGANAILKRLLAASAPALTMPNGNTMLHLAAMNGNLEAINIIDSTGLPVDIVGNKSRTPLHLAAMTGDVAIAEALIDRGANIEARDVEDCTPLMHASMENKPKVVDLLLRRGANPDIVIKTSDSELSPLYVAAIGGRNEVVKLLLASGAPVNKKVGGNYSVVEMAKQAGNRQIVDMLIVAGASLDAKPIECAVPAKHKSTIAILDEALHKQKKSVKSSSAGQYVTVWVTNGKLHT